MYICWDLNSHLFPMWGDDHQPNTWGLHTVPNTTIPYCGGGMTIHKEFRPWHILYSLYIRMQDDANHSKPQGQCNVFLVANLSSPQFPCWKHCLAWDSSQGKSVCLILKGSNGWNWRFWDLCSRIGLSFLVKNVKGRYPNSKLKAINSLYSLSTLPNWAYLKLVK